MLFHFLFCFVLIIGFRLHISITEKGTNKWIDSRITKRLKKGICQTESQSLWQIHKCF